MRGCPSSKASNASWIRHAIRRLPVDWLIGLTDVVRSTQAIEGGRYKAVNTAGASVIAAVSNALQGRSFPYVFGGDGASFAISSQDEALARDALAVHRRLGTRRTANSSCAPRSFPWS